MDIKVHKAYTPEQKASVEESKKRIQRRFREELGLTVDMPKQGFGTSNDGNTARRAFANEAVFADIVRVNIELVKRLKNILITVNSGYEINLEIFKP